MGEVDAPIGRHRGRFMTMAVPIKRELSADAESGGALRYVAFGRDHRSGMDIPLSACIDRVNEGDVVLVKGALGSLGALDDIQRISFDAVAKVGSSDKARRVRVAGFEALHNVLTGDEIFALEQELTRRLLPVKDRLIADLVRQVLRYNGPLYMLQRLWVRLMVPHREYLRNEAQFSTRIGHLQPHNPHRDAWFSAPSNSISVWMAIGHIRHGNSMLFFPDCSGVDIGHADFLNNGHRIDPGLELGRPISFALDPGDLILFDGTVMHATELNATEETRYVLTGRFMTGQPENVFGNRWIAYRDMDLADTNLTFASTWRSRLNKTYLRHLLYRRLFYFVRMALGRTSPGVKMRPGAVGMPPPLELCVADIAALQPDEIRAVSADRCVARTGAGVFVFPRHCPHAGADLANGYIEGGKLRCPWHNLAFDLKSGAPACPGAPALQSTPIAEKSSRLG